MRFIPVHTGNIPAKCTSISSRPVYPCAYREHLCNNHAAITKNGLSLCIQGTSIDELDMKINDRFIPVHTGNILGNMTGALLTSVYPCAYREHDYRPIDIGTQVGLSLCIQGTLLDVMDEEALLRFIPVHTGNI